MKLILAACLLGFVAATPLPREVPSELLSWAAQIKLIIHTDYGYQQVKHYLVNLKSQDPVANEIRGIFNEYSDEELKQVLIEFFNDVPTIAIEPIPGFKYPGLKELFGRMKPVLVSEEGVGLVREYCEKLETSNEILIDILDYLLDFSDAQLQNFVQVIFSDLSAEYFAAEYGIKEELDDTVQKIKAILITSEGIQLVRNQLNSIESTNPTVILIKTVLSAMSDKSLIDLVKELGKNIPDVQLDLSAVDLMQLVRKGKDLILEEEGIGFVREYMKNLKTGNFLLVRMRTFLEAQNNEQIFQAIRNGWKEIFGEDAILLYPEYVQDLDDLFSQIKYMLNTEAGFKALKAYLSNLQPQNIYVQIGKTYFLQMDEDQMKEVVREMLKNIPDIVDVGFEKDLGKLFGHVKEVVLTSQGMAEIREYAVDLETDNLIVQRLRAALITVDDHTLRGILVDLFQGI